MPSVIKRLATRFVAYFLPRVQKAQLVEVVKRSAVTFGSVFTAQLALAEAQITNLSTARVVVVSAAAFAANVVYRTIVMPKVHEVFVPVAPTPPATPVPPSVG